MYIEQKTAYIYKGKEFNSLKDVKIQVENELGKILDNLLITGKEKIKIFNLIVDNKEKIVDLLTTKVELEEVIEAEIKTKNILDIK